MVKHILLALSPFPEKRPKNSVQRAAWVNVINRYFRTLFESKDLCFSVVLGPFHDAYWKTNYQNSYSKITKNICLDPEKYTNNVCTYKTRNALYIESQKSDFVKTLAAEIIGQYGDLPPPDLILQFNHHAPYLLSAFKDSPLLNFHEGGLSRTPFPPSWRFESGKFLSGSDFSVSLASGRNNNETGTKNDVVDLIRHNSFAALNRINPFKRKLRLWKKKYRRLHLLPLHVSGYVSFDMLCEYENQYHFLTDVLENTSTDVGLIVTEHPGYPVITTKMNDELNCRFPNYIYEADFSLIMNVSTYFVPYVDAVITVSSSVFWHAALMGKTCCGLGTGEFSMLADTNSLQGLNELSTRGALQPYRYDALIYRRLTQNWVPDSLMKEPEFLERWLKHLCSKVHPKPTISDDTLKQDFASAINNLQYLKRNPFTILKGLDLPMSCKSAFDKADPTLLRMVVTASPFAKKVRPYISKLYRNLQFGLRFLKRKFKASLA